MRRRQRRTVLAGILSGILAGETTIPMVRALRDRFPPDMLPP
jgi:hypothetical protein